MNGNPLTDDRTRLLDQLTMLRDKIQALRQLVAERNWRTPTHSALRAAFRQLNLASDFVLEVADQLRQFRRETTEWREIAEATLEASPRPLLVTDDEHRIRLANQPAARLFNVPPARLEQHSLDEVFSPDDLPELDGEPTDAEPTLSPELADLGGLEVGVAITPLGESPQRYLGRRRDPPTVHSIELGLPKLQKNAGLGRMATGMTHEFKNILGIITTWCELGLRNEECPESVQTSLRKINYAANRGATLTESILSYGQHDHGEATQLDVNELLASNIETLAALLPGRIQVDLRVADEPIPIHFDRNQFEQILLNLMLNARDAISETGTITCRGRRVTLEQPNDEAESTELAPGEYVEIAIEDTGCGMDDETLAEATAPFYSTKREDGGTGLGLPTVVELVSRAEGGVLIDSEAGEGTTVRVLFPSVGGAEAGE